MARVKKICQGGFVVRNVQEAARHFQEDYGIGEWRFSCPDEDLGELLINEKPGKFNLKVAMSNAMNIELELMEPVGEGPYMDYLKEHGPGVHHIAVLMEDGRREVQEVLEREKAAGHPIFVHAEMAKGEPGRKMDCTCIDRRADMGAILEVYNEDR